MFSATFLNMNLTGISWTCAQKVALSNFKFRGKLSFSYCWRTTKCLSKLHVSLFIILSTSGRLLKTNNTLWSPKARILKPFVKSHSYLKVLATASIFSTRVVKNFSAPKNSLDRWNFWRTRPELSFSNERQITPQSCQVIHGRQWKDEKRMIKIKLFSYNPQKKNPLAQEASMWLQETNSHL